MIENTNYKKGGGAVLIYKLSFLIQCGLRGYLGGHFNLLGGD
jgi:hypothetical protein